MKLLRNIVPHQKSYELIPARNITFAFNNIGYKTIQEYGNSNFYCFDDSNNLFLCSKTSVDGCPYSSGFIDLDAPHLKHFDFDPKTLAEQLGHPKNATYLLYRLRLSVLTRSDQLAYHSPLLVTPRVHCLLRNHSYG